MWKTNKLSSLGAARRADEVFATIRALYDETGEYPVRRDIAERINVSPSVVQKYIVLLADERKITIGKSGRIVGISPLDKR